MSTRHSGSTGIVGLILVFIAVIYFSRRLRGGNPNRPPTVGEIESRMPTPDTTVRALAFGIAAIAPEPPVNNSADASTAGIALAEPRAAVPGESRRSATSAPGRKKRVAGFGVQRTTAPTHRLSAIAALTSTASIRAAVPARPASAPTPPMDPRDALLPHKPVARRGT